MFIAPSYSENIEEIENTLAMYLKGAEIKSEIIAQEIVGKLGYRRLSEEQTLQYPIIEELEQQEKTKQNED